MTARGGSIEVVIGSNALARLAARAGVDGATSVLLVMDANTREAAGLAVGAVLRASGMTVREFTFRQRQGLLPGLAEVAAVRARAGDGGPLVAVGSGVITDIVRYAAHLDDRAFVSVPTAASMDGYTSSLAALELSGVKVTYPARAPKAVFADPAIAASAPQELTRAGLGDLLGKATARADWLAAHLLLDEPFLPEVDDQMLVPLRFAAENAGQVLGGDTDSVGMLLRGLVQSGIAMTEAGSSRPASGCEHHASHFWDLQAARGLRRHELHGLQVGYATRFAMRLQRFAFGGGVRAVRPQGPVADPLGPAALEWLGEPTPELEEAVADKQRLLGRTPVSWPGDASAWERVRAQMSPALGLFAAVESALDTAGFPDEPGYFDVDERMLRATFRYATRLRARYTAVDFLEGQGRLEEAIEAALAPSGLTSGRGRDGG